MIVMWYFYPDFSLAISDAAVHFIIFSTVEEDLCDVYGEVVSFTAERSVSLCDLIGISATVTLDCMDFEVVAGPLLLV
jgi:hypothetical protein